uniref:Uncharacterized protein n=1 Tax=Anguilla anguilla TaxID=7936 RepID=A0A0E9VTV8_ANGAN
MNLSPPPQLCACSCSVKRRSWLAGLCFGGEPWIVFTLQASS